MSLLNIFIYHSMLSWLITCHEWHSVVTVYTFWIILILRHSCATSPLVKAIFALDFIICYIKYLLWHTFRILFTVTFFASLDSLGILCQQDVQIHLVKYRYKNICLYTTENKQSFIQTFDLWSSIHSLKKIAYVQSFSQCHKIQFWHVRCSKLVLHNALKYV